MIEYLGYIAQVLFVTASMSQAYKSYKDGNSDGISHGLIWSLLVGFSIMISYVIIKIGPDPVLLLGYIGQATFLTIIAKYKYLPRSSENTENTIENVMPIKFDDKLIFKYIKIERED